MTARAGMVAAGVVLVCASVEVYALAERSRGEPRNHDVRRYVLGELYGGIQVEQRFLVKADGLSSVMIHPRPTASNQNGTVDVRLVDSTNNRAWTEVKQMTVPAAAFIRSEAFTIRFLPQQSTYREYALVVTVRDASEGSGIGLLATRGEGYRNATLFVNGRRRFGDLVFETSVDGATSNFASIASTLARGGVPAPGGILLFILVVKNFALFLIIRTVAHA